MRGKVIFTIHSHIDVEWLWDWGETQEVVLETYRNMVEILERYEKATCVSTSSIFLEWIKKKDPELFKRIKRLVEEERFEPVSGLYLEPDCNLPSETSFLKNIETGRKFLRDNFGKIPDIMFIPDSFGFPPFIPYVLREEGHRYFMTSKLNYEARCRFPYYYFIWEGLRGARVLACQTPGMYMGYPSPGGVYSAYWKVKRKHEIPLCIFFIGEGDHGGAVTPSMVEEVLNKRKDRWHPVDELDYSFGTLSSFFAELEKYKDKLPVYSGELYIKTHRGTFTTEAKIKRFLYRAERTLKEIEFLRGNIPELEDLWRFLLFYEFHDTLSGTCIRDVYERFDEGVKEFWKRAEDLRGEEWVNPDEREKIYFVEENENFYRVDMPPRSLGGRKEKLISSWKGEGFEVDVKDGFLKLISGEVLVEEVFLKLVHEMEDDEESAWNILKGREEKVRCEVEEVREGYVRLSGKIGERSRVKMELRVFSNLPFAVLDVEVDWREHWKMLKLGLKPSHPLRRYYTGTQMGIIERIPPFHPDASPEEREKWEVPFQRFFGTDTFRVWVYGKFGMSCEPDGLFLTLLRSSRNPHPSSIMGLRERKTDFQDQGIHRIRIFISPNKDINPEEG